MVLKIAQPRDYHVNFGKWVLLDHLADPGNVGTIIRTADAAGFDGVVFLLQVLISTILKLKGQCKEVSFMLN